MRLLKRIPETSASGRRSFSKSALDMTASVRTTLFPPKQEALLSFDGPVWHFDVFCHGTHIRVPTGADESLPNWLGLIFASQSAVAVELSNYEGNPACLHKRGVVHGNHLLWGTVTITVDILTPPCSPPPP